MNPLILTSVAEAENAVASAAITFGAQIVIDVWPAADDELQEITEDMLTERDAIAQAIADAVAVPVKEEPTLADPLADIRGWTAEQINKEYNKAPMIDLIEAATGERRPPRTKAADLAAELEKLAA